ncbi:MAG: serine/threonine protein kinase [Deltaproteobacteria bacterium]|nr:serine/threonine protein kinase [Deltaproteobacteria bacterium]
MPSPAVCERFGRYRLLHRFAVGGMAEIFLARASGSRDPEQLLVIKRMRAELAKDQVFIDMFVDEQSAISRLDHPNIVRVLDCGEIDGRYFLALEHIWGESLTTLVGLCAKAMMRFPLRAALHIGVAVASALHHAHSQVGVDGRPAPVVHRDVTLGNVMISYQGAIKVLDFGLAKFADRQAHTSIGQIKGTLAYLAPEQVTGDEAVPATDVYQLGVLLYKTLVGREPVTGPNEMAVMKSIVSGDLTRPSAVVPGFPPRLEQILLKAMARQPIARFADAGELAVALSELAPAEPDAGERLARMVKRISGDRYQQQQAFVRALLAGAQADEPAGVLWRGQPELAEPKTIEVELSSIIGVEELRAELAPDDPRSLIAEFGGTWLARSEAAVFGRRAPTLVDENAGGFEPALVSDVFRSLPHNTSETSAPEAQDDRASTQVGGPALPQVDLPAEPTGASVFEDRSGTFAEMPPPDPAAPTKVTLQPIEIGAAESALDSIPTSPDANPDNVPTRVSTPPTDDEEDFDSGPTVTMKPRFDAPTLETKKPLPAALRQPEPADEAELGYDLEVTEDRKR